MVLSFFYKSYIEIQDDEDDDEINVQDLEDENCRSTGLGIHHHQNGLTGLDGREYTPGELEEYQPRYVLQNSNKKDVIPN